MRFLVHGCLSHKRNDLFFIGYSTARPRNLPKVLLQPFYPVRDVDHGLDAVSVIQVSEMRLVGSVLAASLDASVVSA